MGDEYEPILTQTPRRSLEREGHFGIKGIALVLSVVSVAIVCIVVNVVPLRQNPPGTTLPHAIHTPNPIIGIWSQPASMFSDAEYIAFPYVQWIESAGGRVVRIPYNATDDELGQLLGKINGVLFPGGESELNHAAVFIYERAKAINENGSHFPIWGTSQGFQFLLQLESHNESILDQVEAVNSSTTIKFVRGKNRLFGFSSVFDIMESEPVAAHFHKHGILLDHFTAYPALNSFFQALATSKDRRGRQYVDAIEARYFPFYGVQFHPEMNAFEFGKRDDGELVKPIDHSLNAILVSQALANFFVQEARRNRHHFETASAERAVILSSHQTTYIPSPIFQEFLLFNATL
ncbi:hypothetical protein AC1031_000417 [Aphanomyces cochlioides]|nr:hypothetical protein AC1031_000417 [Aphanomyces cochlioides]